MARDDSLRRLFPRHELDCTVRWRLVAECAENCSAGRLVDVSTAASPASFVTSATNASHKVMNPLFDAHGRRV